MRPLSVRCDPYATVLLFTKRDVKRGIVFAPFYLAFVVILRGALHSPLSTMLPLFTLKQIANTVKSCFKILDWHNLS